MLNIGDLVYAVVRAKDEHDIFGVIVQIDLHKVKIWWADDGGHTEVSKHYAAELKNALDKLRV